MLVFFKDDSGGAGEIVQQALPFFILHMTDLASVPDIPYGPRACQA